MKYISIGYATNQSIAKTNFGEFQSCYERSSPTFFRERIDHSTIPRLESTAAAAR